MIGLDNPLHIAFLLIVALMVFGAKRLPEMGKSLGAGMRGFKEALNPDTAVVAQLGSGIAGEPEVTDVRVAPASDGAGAASEQLTHVEEDPIRERAAA